MTTNELEARIAELERGIVAIDRLARTLIEQGRGYTGIRKIWDVCRLLIKPEVKADAAPVKPRRMQGNTTASLSRHGVEHDRETGCGRPPKCVPVEPVTCEDCAREDCPHQEMPRAKVCRTFRRSFRLGDGKEKGGAE